MGFNLLLKTFTQLVDARKGLFAQTHLVRCAPKAQDTLSIFPEMEAFKDPLTFEIGYPSSLGYSFVIMIEGSWLCLVLVSPNLKLLEIIL